MKQTTFSFIYFFIDHLHKTKYVTKLSGLISVMTKHDMFIASDRERGSKFSNKGVMLVLVFLGGMPRSTLNLPLRGDCDSQLKNLKIINAK